MPAEGYIQVNAYTSNARIPLEGVAISVTAEDGTAIALRLTDRNGMAKRITVPTPELSAGQTPDTGEIPFTSVNLYARLEAYEQYENENLQVFPDTVTRVNLELIPVAELPDSWARISLFQTVPQDL